MLGHHSWDFTASTYVHLGDDDLPDGAVLGDLVGSVATESGHGDRESRTDPREAEQNGNGILPRSFPVAGKNSDGSAGRGVDTTAVYEVPLGFQTAVQPDRASERDAREEGAEEDAHP